MKRFGISIICGIFIASGLFLTMALMIEHSGSYKKSKDDNLGLNFIRVKRSEHMEARDRKKPKPPEKKTPPKKPKLNIAQDMSPQTPPQAMDIPKFDMPLALGNGPSLGSPAAAMSGNGDVVPIVRIEPRYPRKAAMAGIEGWVQLKFEITEAGTVENVEVLKAKPKRIFDKEAIKTLLKWKYKPKLVDGKPARQAGNTVQIDFKLEG